MKQKTAILLSAAVSGLLVAGSNCQSSDKKMDTMEMSAEGKCWNVNTCKGQGACGAKDGSHACAGKNACKGKGFLKMSKTDCEAKGGSFEA